MMRNFMVRDIIPPVKVKKYAKKPDSAGPVPFVSCQTTNNGIACMCDIEPEVENCITVSTNGNCFDCFYHDYAIVPSTDVEVLYKKGITDVRERALYLCAVLRPFTKLYSYSNKPKNGKVFDTIIALPVIESSDPHHVYTPDDIDWAYMENHIRRFEEDHIHRLEAYLRAAGFESTILTPEEQEVLRKFRTGGVIFRKYRICELFDLVPQSYKASKLDFCKSGTTPAYSSNTRNNGLLGYVNHVPEFIVSESTPVYLVFGDHTRTRNIVHQSFVGMDNVKVLRPKGRLTDEQLLYISSAWQKSIPSLGYARHWSVAKKALFLLPSTPSGDPDYALMEVYIRALEKQAVSRLDAMQKEEEKITKKITKER